MNSVIKILIADDNAEFSKLLSHFLSMEEDMNVVGIAEDGLQALEMIEQLSPDVVILDIIMPNLDGIGVLERLAPKPSREKPLIIMLSGIGQDTFIQKAISLGAEYYIVKPFDAGVLLTRVRQIYNEKHVSWFSNVTVNKADVKPKIAEVKPKIQESNENNAGNDNNMEIIVTGIIRDIGIPAHMSGYQYLREAILQTLKNSKVFKSVTKSLYPAVAERFNTSPQKVERAIRNAIESAWAKGNTAYLDSIFGSAALFNKGRPTNSEFIAVVAEKIRMLTARR